MPPYANSPLADQADRERFATELQRNFSVIAPAGVGKTTAIVARVAALAKADALAAEPVLPRLAVVTYTRKAAEEMQSRARARLLADGGGPEQLSRFSQAFFGTIHSLCLLVLKSYGHLVGLPSNLEQTTALEPLWRQYLRSTDNLLHHLPKHAREPFLRHGSLSAALELVLKLPADLPVATDLPPAPQPDIRVILEAEPSKNKKAQANIVAGQNFARRWLHSLQHASGHLPLPRQSTGGKDFIAAYAEAFRPLCDWLGEATLVLAQGVAADFRNYRKAQGKLSFDDMVSWAAKVLDHREAGDLLRRQRWCVILDEAQDTDPTQFHVLLSLAGAKRDHSNKRDHSSTEHGHNNAERDHNSAERGHNNADALPPHGRFCMVGDPQQAIYGGRADLATYRGIHDALIDNERGEALRFTVTMRCDRAIVAVANRVFPSLLKDTAAGDRLRDATAGDRLRDATADDPLKDTVANNPLEDTAAGDLLKDTAADDPLKDDIPPDCPPESLKRNPVPIGPRQVPYVPLQPRPDAGPGRVSRLALSDEPDDPNQPEDEGNETETDAPQRIRKSDADRLAAQALARAIAMRTPADFGAADWSEVAILCVRNEPLGKLGRALQEAGLPVQNHSRQDSHGDNPAYAWFAGLARIMAEPENAFETAGVLREVFGLSDSALYAYTLAAGHTREETSASGNRHHPLSLSAGALALSQPQIDAEIKAVDEALQELRAIHSRVATLPLREGARELSLRLDLPGRLASLPDTNSNACIAELENLLLQASASQEQDYDWAHWADALEENFEMRLDSAEPLPGHIQLLSCHKSKGLQWPVVILASLFRPVGYAADNFPKLLLPGYGIAPCVAFAAGHGHAATEALLKLKALQELQRLAYVACTRARRQMIWADDSVFYDKTDGSFADALGITDGDNREIWQGLPDWLPVAATTTSARSAAARSTVDADSHARSDGTHADGQSDTADNRARSDSTHPDGQSDAGGNRAQSDVAHSDGHGQGDGSASDGSASDAHASEHDSSSGDSSASAMPPVPAFIATGSPLPLADAAHPRPDWHLSFADTTQPQNSAGNNTFIRRVLPSSLAIHQPRRPLHATDTATDATTDAEANTWRGHARNEPDGSQALPTFAELEEKAAASAGADYGNWWHRAMEQAPWGASKKHWQQHQNAMLALCPNPRRGEVEWQLFLASELYRRLNQPQMIVRCELPLLWADPSADIAYDGFIDLVARDTETNHWLLVDWKTDRLHAFKDPQAELLRCYGPQLEAYRKALCALFDAPVQACLYNTPSGKCSALPKSAVED